jgi:GH24 family phage-related lysozyme (muramidase)
MAAGSNVLKEFLVKIGFSVDQTKYRNFNEAMGSISKRATEITRAFAKTTAGMTTAFTGMAAAAHVVAKPLEQLYYAVQRTGASAKELDSLQYAFQQIGISAEEAKSSVDALATARRNNPGLNGLLAGEGINPAQTDNARVLIQLLEKLRTAPPYQATQIAGMFGISDDMLTQIRNNGPAFVSALREREAMIRKNGVDLDKQAAAGLEYERRLNRVKKNLGDVNRTLFTSAAPGLEHGFDQVERGATAFERLDRATGGWASKLVVAGMALNAMTASMGLLSKLGLFGRVGGAAAAGEGTAAAAGAAEVAGGAGLGAVALPAIIIAAVGAALVWMMTHRDQVRASVGGFIGSLKKDAQEAHEMFKHDKTGFLKGMLQTGIEAVTGITPGTLSAVAGKAQAASAFVGSGLLGMLQHFEGHAKNGYGVYRDVAGRLTAGFGHLVRPGEDFSHLDRSGALALLGKDTARALAAVHRLVKVALTGTQEQALADFVFNLGSDKLAHSTLLRKLNSGDYAGAAAQFQHWNHALVNGHMQTVAALTARRAVETDLFRAPGKTVHIEQKNNFQIESTDPREAASETERRQRRANADLVRNFAGAYQ